MKATQVLQTLRDNNLHPGSICEVGCSSGHILRTLGAALPQTRLVSYDISPQVEGFWDETRRGIENRLTFHLADFHAQNTERFDVLLMLDVFEHVRDPFTFLEKSRAHADRFVFQIPLDLGATAVARRGPLVNALRRVGHLHSYTKELALETLTDCGYSIRQWRYTGATFTMPSLSIETKIASIPRHLAAFINKDWAVRVFGGETLLVLAE